MFLQDGMGSCAVNRAWAIEWLILCMCIACFTVAEVFFHLTGEQNQSFLPGCIIWYTAFGKFLPFLTVLWKLAKNKASAAKHGQPHIAHIARRAITVNRVLQRLKMWGWHFYPQGEGFSCCRALKKLGNWWCVFSQLCLGWVEDAKKHVLVLSFPNRKVSPSSPFSWLLKVNMEEYSSTVAKNWQRKQLMEKGEGAQSSSL